MTYISPADPGSHPAAIRCSPRYDEFRVLPHRACICSLSEEPAEAPVTCASGLTADPLPPVRNEAADDHTRCEQQPFKPAR